MTDIHMNISHPDIFCISCAQNLFNSNRLCPACDGPLPDPDDIAQTNLSPNQAFKTTILAGMHPSVINDICGRALSFWTYQQSQEAAFQAMIAKDSQERSAVLEVNKVVREANSQITLMRDKVTNLQKELDQTLRRNHELAEKNKQTTQEYSKLRGQYDKLANRSAATNINYALGKSSMGQTPLHLPRAALQAQPFHPNVVTNNTERRRTLPVNHQPQLFVDRLTSTMNAAPARSTRSGSGSSSTRSNGRPNQFVIERAPALPTMPNQYTQPNIDRTETNTRRQFESFQAPSRPDSSINLGRSAPAVRR